MSRRTLIIAGLSATFAFAGGYALLGSMQPRTTGTQVVSRTPDVSKVVATPGTALVPVGNGTDEWMLIGADGTVLAGPDGRPPAALDVGAPVTEPESGYWESDYGSSSYEGHDDEDDDDGHARDRQHRDDDDDEEHDHHHEDDHHAVQATGTNGKSAERARARSRK